MWIQDRAEGLAREFGAREFDAREFDAREFDPEDTGEIWIYRCLRCGRLNVFLQSPETSFECGRCGGALNAKPDV